MSPDRREPAPGHDADGAPTGPLEATSATVDATADEALPSTTTSGVLHGAADGPPAPGPRANNFDALRMALALAVIYSHAFGLSGLPEPVVWNRSLGNLAVHGFFAVSGFLITGSFLRSHHVARFATRRALRIVPGLVVATVLSAAVADAFGGYPLNPVPSIINGPVWTLTWEAVAYLLVGLLGVVGVLRAGVLPAFVAAGWVVYLATLGTDDAFALVIAPLLIVFAGGAVLWVHHELLTRRVLALASLGLLLTLDDGVFAAVAHSVGRVVPFAYAPDWETAHVQTALYLLCLPVVVVALGRSTRLTVRLPADLSYGTYLYAWPVSQVLIAVGAQHDRRLTPFTLFAATLVPTLLLAAASWFLVERPALRLGRPRRLRARQADGGT